MTFLRSQTKHETEEFKLTHVFKFRIEVFQENNTILSTNDAMGCHEKDPPDSIAVSHLWDWHTLSKIPGKTEWIN